MRILIDDQFSIGLTGDAGSTSVLYAARDRNFLVYNCREPGDCIRKNVAPDERVPDRLSEANAHVLAIVEEIELNRKIVAWLVFPSMHEVCNMHIARQWQALRQHDELKFLNTDLRHIQWDEHFLLASENTGTAHKLHYQAMQNDYDVYNCYCLGGRNRFTVEQGGNVRDTVLHTESSVIAIFGRTGYSDCIKAWVLLPGVRDECNDRLGEQFLYLLSQHDVHDAWYV